MKNLFITGGLGQDGQILTKILLSKKKYKIFLLAKKKITYKKKNFKYVSTNLLNKKKLDNLFKHNKPDTIVHLASNNPSRNEKSKKLFYLDNINASKNIYYSSIKYNPRVKIIFTNSSQVFKKKYGLVNEKSKTFKRSYYTRFRIDFVNFLKKKKANYVNAILFNHDSMYRNTKFLLPRLINAIKKRNIKFVEKIFSHNLHGDFSHAEDICFGLYKIIETKKIIRNIILSSNKCISVNNLIKYILIRNHINLNVDFKSRKKKLCLKGDNAYAKKVINWKPRKNIFTAIQEIYKNS